MGLYIDVMKNEKGVRAFFSTKDGASSGSPYYHKETLEQLGLEGKILIQPQQVHEAKIGVIGEEQCQIIDEDGNEIAAWARGEEGPQVEAWMQGGSPVNVNPEAQRPGCIRLPRTDGVVTDVKGVLLTTVHADCLPVWFYDEKHQAIGLVHAGWRGILAGIAPKAVELMAEKYGSEPAEIKAEIGPGISLCCFETGPEVIEEFRRVWDFADKYAEPAENRKGGAEGKYYIDLKEINFEELLQAGLLPENIKVSSHCTCCEVDTFASYRREGGTYMRMGAGICLL